MHGRPLRTRGAPRRWVPPLSALLLATTPACAQEGAQRSGGHPSAAETRAAEVIDLVNAGDPAATRAYVEAHFSESFRGFAPVSTHVNILSNLHAGSRELRAERLAETGASSAGALVENELTGEWLTLEVEVEPAPPHRVSGIRIRPAPPPVARPAPPRTEEERVRELDAYVLRLARADAFSGVVLLARDGKPLLLSAHGTADRAAGRAIDAGTRFNLASMNKMVTAVAVAQLVEAGELSFEDPLAKFLPDFPSAAAARKIRIKHLLSHTAGLGSYLGPGLSAARARTVDEMMRFARDTATAFEPGTQWRYSNTGFLVLGKVIEEVTGRSYYDHVREHVYGPAGMEGTDAPERDRLPPDAAIGYERDFSGGSAAYLSNTTELPYRGGPAGGGYSSAPDLLRFAEALRAGRLVSPEMVRVLTSAKPEIGSPEYGYGFSVDPRRGIAGHGGGYRGITTSMDLFLEEGYTAIVLSNRGMTGFPIVQRVRDLFADPPAAAPSP